MPSIGRLRFLEATPTGSIRHRGVVVLLHAFPLNAHMWQPQFDRLSADGWRVIAPHVRGVDGGASDPPTAGIDDYAADLVDLLDALRIEEAVIGGCSMGGYLAFAMMRLAPNYFRGLLLIDTRSQADAPDALEGRRKLLKLAEEQGPAGVLGDMEPKLLGATTRRERPAVVEQLRGIAMRNSNVSVAGMVRALMSRRDSSPLLTGIRVPTLIVVGEEDAITPLALSEQMHAAVAGSELEVLPRVGHLPNLEDPARFSDVLANFLAHRV
jgi:pimeloyl-ACP methyl ester carboxylesterase